MDDPEYEVDDVRSHSYLSVPPTLRRQPFPPGTLLSGRWRLGLAVGSLALAVVVILSAWLPLHDQVDFSTGVPSPTPQATATPVLVPVGVPTPLPITSTLAAPPANCPGASSPLTTITVPAFGGLSGSKVQLSGHSPVWIPADNLPQSITDIPEQAPPSTTAPAWWPSIFILWEIGPMLHPTVTVQVHNLQSGALAWWTEGGSTPQVPILVLLPPDEPAPAVYSSYQTDLFITHAGCYRMTATWPGGNWSLIFAAGWGPNY